MKMKMKMMKMMMKMTVKSKNNINRKDIWKRILLLRNLVF